MVSVVKLRRWRTRIDSRGHTYEEPEAQPRYPKLTGPTFMGVPLEPPHPVRRWWDGNRTIVHQLEPVLLEWPDSTDDFYTVSAVGDGDCEGCHIPIEMCPRENWALVNGFKYELRLSVSELLFDSERLNRAAVYRDGEKPPDSLLDAIPREILEASVCATNGDMSKEAFGICSASFMLEAPIGRFERGKLVRCVLLDYKNSTCTVVVGQDPATPVTMNLRVDLLPWK